MRGKGFTESKFCCSAYRVQLFRLHEALLIQLLFLDRSKGPWGIWILCLDVLILLHIGLLLWSRKILVSICSFKYKRLRLFWVAGVDEFSLGRLYLLLTQDLTCFWKIQIMLSWFVRHNLLSHLIFKTPKMPIWCHVNWKHTSKWQKTCFSKIKNLLDWLLFSVTGRLSQLTVSNWRYLRFHYYYF